MPALRSIPTDYAGITFRSRLEADWAHHLDSLDIAWSYEPDGVILPAGQLYLPDFWLPEIKTWLEVKGPGVPGVDKTDQLVAALAEPESDDLERGDYGWGMRQCVVLALPAVGRWATFAVACRYCGCWVPSFADEISGSGNGGAYVEACTGCSKTMFTSYDDRRDGCGMESRCWLCGEKTSRWGGIDARFNRLPRRGR